jgi:hypothetical protein
LREDVEHRLNARGLDAAQRTRCYEVAVEDWGFDLAQVLPPADAVTGRAPHAAGRQPVDADRKNPVRDRSETGGGAW